MPLKFTFSSNPNKKSIEINNIALVVGLFAFFLRRKRDKKNWLAKFKNNIEESKKSEIQLLFIGTH